MPKARGWNESRQTHGVVDIHTSSWHSFMDFIEELHDRTQCNDQYIWRGQRCSSWRLRSSLDRALRERGLLGHDQRQMLWLQKFGDDSHFYAEHLERFKYSIRGRKGPNQPLMNVDNDWWALGQHNGLITPLLDWTNSPYVACFFAFFDEGPSQTKDRAIYGLWESDVAGVCERIQDGRSRKRRRPIIEFIRPLSDGNPRLVSQGGLFTRAPIGMDIEDWITNNFEEDYHFYVLIRILLPDGERRKVLRSLSLMNINHLSLFPDLSGAAYHCNNSLFERKH